MSNTTATINQAGITVGEPAIIRQEGVFTELQVEKVTRTQFTAGGVRFHNSGAPVGDTRDAKGWPITAATASAHGTSWHWASWPMFHAMADEGLTVEGPVANITYSTHVVRDPFLGELGVINTNSFQMSVVRPDGAHASVLTWAEAVAFLTATEDVDVDRITLEARVAILRAEVAGAEAAVRNAEELHADRVERQLGLESSREGLAYAQRSLVHVQGQLAAVIQELAEFLDAHGVVLEDPQDVRWILQDQAKEDQERAAAEAAQEDREDLEHADQLAVLELSGADVIPAGTALERHSHVEVHPLVEVPIPDTSGWAEQEPTEDVIQNPVAQGLAAFSAAQAALEERESTAASRTLLAATQDRAEATYWTEAEVTTDTAVKAAEGVINTLTQGLRVARTELDRVRTMNENPAEAKARVDQLEDRLRQALVNRGHGGLVRYVDLVEVQKWVAVKAEAEKLIRDMPVWVKEPTESHARSVWMDERHLVNAARGVRLMEGNVAGLSPRTTENAYGQDTVKANARVALRDLDHAITHLHNSRQRLAAWKAKAPETVEELEAYVRVCEELAEAATDAWMASPQGPELESRHREEQVAVKRWGQAFRALQKAKVAEDLERSARVQKVAERYRRHLPDAPAS